MPPIITQALERLYFPKWNPREIREYKSDMLDKEMYATQFASEKIEGKAELLITLLEEKFGILAQSYIAKIMNADSNRLSLWAINCMRGKSLEAVFQNLEETPS